AYFAVALCRGVPSLAAACWSQSAKKGQRCQDTFLRSPSPATADRRGGTHRLYELGDDNGGIVEHGSSCPACDLVKQTVAHVCRRTGPQGADGPGNACHVEECIRRWDNVRHTIRKQHETVSMIERGVSLSHRCGTWET